MQNLFSPHDSAMLLIDHQVGTIKLAVSTPHAEILRNTRALARTAVQAGMPLVLTTSQEDRFQGPLLEDLLAIAPDAHAARVKRPGVVDCWTYAPFRDAVLATGRRKLIMAGLTNDVCIVYPAISATEEGFSVQVVCDAGGSPTRAADDAALRRMAAAGVVVTSTNQVMAELATDWASPTGGAIQRIMYEEILRHLVEA
jgi:nicotinamidase-related amidase